MSYRLDPLSAAVPIVDKFGRPTPEFMQKWNASQKLATVIPALSTPSQVSAVLDVLGATPNTTLLRGASQWNDVIPSAVLDVIANTPGALLLRGASAWGGLNSPSDTTKFLNGAASPVWGNVHDSDLSISNITTNDVSISAHGFAPKLPNDNTKFLDGTGHYTAPGGGGGGGALALLGTFTGTSVATLDIAVSTFTAYKELQIHVMLMEPAVTGAGFQMRLSQDGGVTYLSGGSDYEYGHARVGGSGGFFVGTFTNVGPDSSIQMNAGNGVGDRTDRGVGGVIKTSNWTVATQSTRFMYDLMVHTDNDLRVRFAGGAACHTPNVMTNVRLYFNNGNIASYDVRLLGMQ